MKRICLAVLSLLLWGISCTNGLEEVINLKDNAVNESSLQQEVEAISVSEGQALSVACKFQNIPQTRSKEDVDIQTIFDENNQPLMYIFNYPERKFVIVGATKNYYPILAYSDKDNFSIDRIEGSGLELWLTETKYAIKSSNNFGENVTSQMKFLWNFYSDQEEATVPETRASSEENVVMRKRMVELMELYPGFVCRPLSQCKASDFPLYGVEIYNKLCQLATQNGSPIEYTICGIKNNNSNNIVGPLLETEWHQYSPFSDPYDDHRIGCATVAMAQIMRFHQFPTQYNWSNIPVEYGIASNETHRLIADILPALEINPYKDSGANIDDAQRAFKSFQYTVQKKDHNATDVKNELLINRRPVYMRGRDSNKSKNHAWVCDGVNAYTHGALYFIEYRTGGVGNYHYQNIDEYSPQYPGEIVYTGAQYHMNWGTEKDDSGNNSNGWFQSNNVAAGIYDFSKDRENLYVTPNR